MENSIDTFRGMCCSEEVMGNELAHDHFSAETIAKPNEVGCRAAIPIESS